MSNSLLLPTKELRNAVRILHKLLNKIKPKPGYPILDVIVKLNSVELRLVGMSQLIKCSHKEIFSFRIPFQNFYTAALGEESNLFKARVKQGSIEISNRVISSDAIELIHPENIQTINLPMNPSVMEILALRFNYSEDELKAKNYWDVLLNQEELLNRDITESLSKLYKYGVKKQQIEKIIRENIELYALK